MRRELGTSMLVAAGVGLALALGFPTVRGAAALSCPSGMVEVRGQFCIDQYEAATVELSDAKRKKVVGRHSPFKPVEGKLVKAVSVRGRTPQAHISRNEAELACYLAGKRLCTDEEWLTACRGKSPTTYPYGEKHKPGYCNDAGTSGFNLLFGGGGEAPQSAYTNENMNDPRLNQVKNTLAPAGSFSKCRNSFRIHDMVGNLHEWTATSSGTFRGGYYLDTTQHGAGCDYVTTAHSAKYYDYSTGFRCCKGGKQPTPVLASRLESSSDKGESPTSSSQKKVALNTNRKPTFGKKRKGD